ncbi:glycosyltransferase [Mucilaginibacter terrenus]|uniref:Glycosyltransferase n=1 Tax=Mucilaginibacter terrenus TaxID=2482727 RepID=A0A3E2NXY6_9SPHI|nr:glycosyltransferase [Mucilaginibacter terrenus]RFZ85781.1 glycosyltransferase [Mucilaginibacter terrenus]
MKLLHIIGSMDPAQGGPCQGIRNTNPGLMEHGISREVVSLDGPESSFLGMDDFPIHALGPAVGPWQYSDKLRPWLLNNMGRFDNIIINGLWLYSSYAGWSVWRTLQKQNKKAEGQHHLPKLYVMPHGMLDPYFQNAPDRKLKALRNWFYWKLVESRVVNDADGLLFTCQMELELARQTFSPYRPKQEINVGYGIVEPPQYNPNMKFAFLNTCKKLKEQPFILFLSRIHRKKGVDLLVNAYLRLLEAANDTGKSLPALVIAGPGLNTAYGKGILKAVNNSDLLKEHVYFPGMLKGDAKWGALYTCEAFVLPSHQENFGIAVVEALACAKPVLITNEINIWKEIEEGAGGIVVNDDQEDINSQFKIWIETTENDKENMRLNAREVYKKCFTVERSVKELVKILGNNELGIAAVHSKEKA